MRKSYYAPSHGIQGINMTPIIDVALVLVIILMITAPIFPASDLTVNLPSAHGRDFRPGKRS